MGAAANLGIPHIAMFQYDALNKDRGRWFDVQAI
jgi:hypothetical protein